MTYRTLEPSYGVETRADAIFDLERSDDPADRQMAIDHRNYDTGTIVAAGRRVSRARIEAVRAKAAA